MAWCDVCLHNNLSLRAAWPLLARRKPWVIAHHTHLTRVDGRVGWRDRLKQRVIRHARNIAVSRAVAAHLAAPSVVIGNPYRASVFRELPGIARDRDLVFVGRLIAEKGLDVLLLALAWLRGHGLHPRLTVVGEGPAEPQVRALCTRLILDDRVEFAGRLDERALAELLNRHRIMVIPSLCVETFGLVALEGIACGCVPVASALGGLPEAVGECGLLAPPDDAAGLARVLADLLKPGADLARFRAAAPAHLARHEPRAIAAEYLRVLDEARR
jgi:glycosyltransferase involved in cell wall biosynthesis